jgi:hypothetical protein
MDVIPCTGVIINSAYSLGWDSDVTMFEHFKVPIWVYWPSNVVHHKAWNKYMPSAADITAATQPSSGSHQGNDQWGIELGWSTQSDDNTWSDQNLSKDDLWRTDLWGMQPNDLAPVSIVQP